MKEQIDEQKIEEMRKDLIEIFDEEYEKRRLITPQKTAEKMTAKGYRKQSEGEWVVLKESKYRKSPACCCSLCGAFNNNLPTDQDPYRFIGSNFCPNCGAKMKGEKK
jgi:hypothetical protein